MLTESVIERILSGMNYQDYNKSILKRIEELNLLENPAKEIAKFDLIRLNSIRTKRIDNTFVADDETKELISGITEKQYWLIITEPWCGDSAQNIPYLAAIASLNPLIEIKLLLRDQNPDIMNMYLSNGARSIPKLIAFDEQWNELFRWGSKPEAAKELVLNLKNQGADKKLIQEKLHTWYARNKGKDITKEISEILLTILTSELL